MNYSQVHDKSFCIFFNARWLRLVDHIHKCSAKLYQNSSAWAGWQFVCCCNVQVRGCGTGYQNRYVRCAL